MKIEEKRNNGITLIALVITIVVLIILASVAITLSLGDNGVFKKATKAKEDTLVAQNEESMQIAEVTNSIDIITGSRDTVTIDKDEYNKLKLRNQPEMWTVGVEQNFDNGVYGMRFTGTVTGTANTAYALKDSNGNNIVINQIIDEGGWIDWGMWGSHAPYAQTSAYCTILTVGSKGNETLNLQSSTTGITYDIWVLYTKN